MTNLLLEEDLSYLHTIIATNELPTGADKTVRTDEDTAYTFTIADFEFKDADIGDALQRVKITVLPTVGSLQLNGGNVSKDTEISVTDIISGNLKFIPVANANGTNYANFQFQVSDTTAYSASDYTMTVDVTAVNDLPTGIKVNNLPFQEDVSMNWPFGVSHVSVAWGDYNGDDKMDFLVNAVSGPPWSRLYKNTGSGFEADLSINLPGLYDGSGEWGDYNADGKQDLLLTGYTNSLGYISRLYKNTGNGFEEDSSINLPGVAGGSVAWEDYNGDSKPDLVFTGGNTLKLYKNTGSGFEEDLPINLPNVGFGSSVVWGDYNGDGKKDFLLTGSNTLKLYKNIGSGFEEDLSINLPSVSSGSVAWGDYNGDSKKDFLLTGYNNSSGYISRLYKNTGNGFEEDLSINLPGVYGSVVWGDYNGDGKQDFLLTGYNNQKLPLSKLYRNTGSGFEEDLSVSLPIVYGSVLWGNYNGDSKQDLFLSGYTGSRSGYILRVYLNTIGINTDENTAYTFTIADFGFQDVDTGDTLQKVKITTLPIAGNLQLDGTNITVDTEISSADIISGKFKFVPLANENGQNHLDFQFQVSDGTAYSASAYTMTVNVTPVNSLPTDLTLSNNSIDENSGNNAVIGQFNATDPDNDSITYSLVSGEGDTDNKYFNIDENGQLTINDSPDFETKDNYSIRVVAKDQEDSSEGKQFTININDVNEKPSATGKTVSTGKNTGNPVSKITVEVGDNISDPDNNGLTGAILKVTKTTNGNVISTDIDQDLRNITFTPNTGFVGTASFEYTITDASGLQSNPAKVIVEVGDILSTGNKGQDILGNAGNDYVSAGNGKDNIQGLGGNDTLLGNNGVDKIDGGNGDDLIDGGNGPDLLTGGVGRDKFVLTKNTGGDTITDFKLTDDFIKLVGGLTFNSGNSTTDIKQTQSGNNILLYSPSNNLLATLQNVSDPLTTSNFI